MELAELLGVLSLATDLGMGQPMEHMLRQCLIAVRLSERMGLDESERDVVYYTSLLAWVGCNVDAYEQAKWFGDEFALKADARLVDFTGPAPAMQYVFGHLGSGKPGLERIRLGMAFLAGGHRDGEVMLENHWRAADEDDQAIARGRAEAADEGLQNLTFELRDVASLTVEEPFDAVFVFDAIHDMADPSGALERIHAALTPGGVFVMKEPRLSSNLEDNIGNPFAPMAYAASTLHCMTVSLAQGGAGLGTAFGEQLARRMLADAGFIDVSVHEAPGDPRSGVFVGTRPLS